MKDQVFSGPDVEGAVGAAARALGVAPSSLRYVVLDKGASGGRGLAPTPARIAVLGAGAETSEEVAPEPPPRSVPGEFPARVREVVRVLAQSSELDLDADVETTTEGVVVTVQGADWKLLGEEDAEFFPALEHLLQRMAGRPARRVRLEAPGFESRRDEGLRIQARDLAEAVRRDGLPRLTGPLNSYERRIVHLTLSEEKDIRTFSVGEGSERRVTVSPREPEPPEES